MNRCIVALDADGVLLDYSLAYAGAWERAFGARPAEQDPQAYWPMDRWQVEHLAGDRLERFRSCFDEVFWSGIPAMEGAAEACQILTRAGYELVCVTALPEQFRQARQQNLRRHGFPIERVYTVEHSEGNPKAQVLNALGPVAFVDDYLPYLMGIDPAIHSALVERGGHGSPNTGEDLRLAASRHGSLLEFARWWVGSQE